MAFPPTVDLTIAAATLPHPKAARANVESPRLTALAQDLPAAADDQPSAQVFAPRRLQDSLRQDETVRPAEHALRAGAAEVPKLHDEGQLRRSGGGLQMGRVDALGTVPDLVH